MNFHESIGVFDSGVGGLTVAAAIHKLLPAESITYLGDTARLPYGSKSPETIIKYAEHAANFLLAKNIKALVIACNTATAAALTDLQKMTAIPVIGVIKPGAAAAVAAGRQKIGVIGTNATVASGAYERAIKELNPEAEVHSVACPLFVPLAEENFITHPAAGMIAATYLEPLKKAGVETLVLGCTHYPLLREIIQQVMSPAVQLVDSAATAAASLSDILSAKNLAAPARSESRLDFYVTDDNARFEQIGRNFFGQGFSSLTKVDL